MIGSVPPTNPPAPQFFSRPARAPIQRVPRELDVIGAKPDRQVVFLTPIGQMGTRINLSA